MTLDHERTLAWAQAERERAAVIRLADDLAPAGVSLLVFKGIHLAFAVAPSPDFRLCLDADVLVLDGGDIGGEVAAPRSHAFARAAARIRALAHWKLHDANWSTYGATLDETGAYIDLHRMPLPPRFGRFDVHAARARARPLPLVFGPHVLVPDPLDAAVLAVANYVKDMLGAVGHGKIAADLALLESEAGLAPTELATRLTTHGLRRVGLLAFADLADLDPHWAAYRDACTRSTAERQAVTAFGRRLVSVAKRSERLAFLGVRGVADRPIDGAISLTLAGARLTRDWLFR